MALKLRQTSRTAQGYIEPRLDVGDAIPLHMVRVPGGTFTMGSPDDEPERKGSEGPQHPVTVPTFFMGRYPVTQAQYQQLMGSNPATEYPAGRFVAPDSPVVGVSWKDAVAYCDHLAELTNRPYRLPSEAEWEYACRAGTSTPFYFGKTLTPEIANYDGNYTYGDGPEGEYRGALTPVDHFGIGNAFGLSDMHGNVWEWCQDDWHDSYNDAPNDGTTWVNGEVFEYKILRGGAWNRSPRICRSACRLNGYPGYRNYDIGFRVVCSAPRTLQ